MGSDFIEDPVWGDVPLRFISIKLGPMMFRLNSQVFLKSIYLFANLAYLPTYQPALISYFFPEFLLCLTSFTLLYLTLPHCTYFILFYCTLLHLTLPNCTLV